MRGARERCVGSRAICEQNVALACELRDHTLKPLAFVRVLADPGSERHHARKRQCSALAFRPCRAVEKKSRETLLARVKIDTPHPHAATRETRLEVTADRR